MIMINYTNYNIKNTTRKPPLIEVLFIKYSLALFFLSQIYCYTWLLNFNSLGLSAFMLHFLIEISYYLKS
jgi:hypothetical protein